MHRTEVEEYFVLESRRQNLPYEIVPLSALPQDTSKCISRLNDEHHTLNQKSKAAVLEK